LTVLRSATFPPLGPALRSPLAPRKGGGLSWGSFTAGLTADQVLDIDFGQTDRHWQEATAQTLSASAGDNIGFASDSAAWTGNSYAQVLASQPELTTNGEFTSDISGWSSVGGNSTAWVAGAMQITADAVTSGGRWQDITVSTRYIRHSVRCRRLSGSSSTVVWFIPRTGGFASPNTQIGVTSGSYVDVSITNLREAAATGARVYLQTINGNSVFEIDSVSTKALPGNHGTQSSPSLQGKRQAGGVCRYDGIDDQHLTTFLAQNGAMTLLYHGTIDATIAATQMFLGASGSAANRCWLAVTTAGFIAAGVGSESTTTIVGTTDVRNKTIVAALTFDGSTVKLFLRVDGAATEEYSAAQASTPTTTIPFRVGGYNNNGTAAGFAKVDAKSLKAAHKAMTFSEFKSIAASLAA
jgi:hypothetical protein